MSKIGKKPIEIKDGVEVKIEPGKVIIKGPKGELNCDVLAGVTVVQKEKEIIVSIDNDEIKNLRGLTRTLIANMIEGVVNGYEKKLLIMGVGYGAVSQGRKIVLSLGFSHKIDFELPDGIDAKIEQDPKGNSIVTITGIDKQKVGEITAKMRDLRKPEPYKGKGIRYIDEVVKLKAGKTAKK